MTEASLFDLLPGFVLDAITSSFTYRIMCPLTYPDGSNIDVFIICDNKNIPQGITDYYGAHTYLSHMYKDVNIPINILSWYGCETDSTAYSGQLVCRTTENIDYNEAISRVMIAVWHITRIYKD